MKKILIIITFLSAVLARADMESAKKEAALRFLENSGTLKLFEIRKDRIIDGQRKQIENLPEEFWKYYRAAYSLESYRDALVELYCRHFSLDDLQALGDFYLSPAGKKLVAETEGMEREASKIMSRATQEAIEEAKRKMLDSTKRREKSPNQAPEPTPTTVTPPAGQEARQP